MPTPGKNYEGQVGFPTPNEPIETSACRTFRVPANDEWLGVLMGAVEVLRSEFNWYQWGTLTPQEAADTWHEIIVQAYEDSFDSSCTVGGIPAPFWDTPADADDQLPEEEQVWYGEMEGETFVETLENWAIAGFIAYSGQVGAAVTFLTLAPKFRLAWKTGDLGGIVRVFVDAADAGTVDTFSAEDGILEKDFVGDPEEEMHSILMVLESV